MNATEPVDLNGGPAPHEFSGYEKRVLALAWTGLSAALSDRAFQAIALLLVSAAWGFVLVTTAPLGLTGLRILAATLFTVLVYLPRFWKKEPR